MSSRGTSLSTAGGSGQSTQPGRRPRTSDGISVSAVRLLHDQLRRLAGRVSGASILNACRSRGCSDRARPLSTKVAGWTAVAFGAVHLLVAPVNTRAVWSRVVGEGWWNTFTLAESTSLADSRRSETFWVTLGSFGAPMLILGSYMVLSTQRGQRVPGWIGWSLVAWGVPLVAALPKSPGWAIPTIGALIVVGDNCGPCARILSRDAHENTDKAIIDPAHTTTCGPVVDHAR